MDILITGGKGFLGSYAASLLRERHEVDVVDKDTVDVTDLEAVKGAIARAQPDVVCHLAALCGAQPSRERPHEYFGVNTFGTINVLEACRRLGVTRLLLTSSLTVHGAGDEPMEESSPYAPRHPYAASKVAAEVVTRAYCRDYGMRAVILRPTLVVGEGYKEGHAIGGFVETALNGGEIVIFGEGRHRRDFVHPTDVAEAAAQSVAWLAEAPAGSCDVFNISTGAPIGIAELADMVIALAGRGRKVAGPPTAQAFSLYTRIDRAERTLGWRPRVSTEEIIRRLLRHPQETSRR